jgi:hypoxanthine phosphoribosyltransferase
VPNSVQQAGEAPWPGLTAHVTSADAIPTAATWDPGAEHGYQGELSAVLIPAATLQAKIVELARAVAADHTLESPPLLICVLKGAVMFLTDFARALPIPSELEFMS